MTQKIPALLRFLLLVSITFIVLFGLLRLGFWVWFSSPTDNIPADVLAKSFYIGSKFDMRLSMFIIAPVLILGWIKSISPIHNPLARRIWAAYLGLAGGAVLFVYIMDFGHYSYLRTRIDVTVLRLAEDLETALLVAWQSYPVITLTLALILASAATSWLFYKMAMNTKPGMKLDSKKQKALIATLASVTFLAGCWSNLSWYPLRWSNAFFSTYPFASSVALNPVLYFGETLKNRKMSYTLDTIRGQYDVMAEYLGVDNPDKEKLDFRRTVKPARLIGNIQKKKPNVVLVFLESFAAYKTGVFGNKLDPTPNFDRLAKQGWIFKRHYVPHNGTARNVFALLTGLPDIETNKTSSRNPMIVDQNVIIDRYKGYERFYFLGGSTNWGNIRGVISHNIQNLNIFEEGSYKAPRVDAWGISDIHLFEEASDILAQQEKPFIAILQTSGNHRPYNITDDNKGFVYARHPKKLLKQNGFDSIEEFNSFHFMDHSIGYFIERAKKEKYFRNTVFVFYADHGLLTSNPGNHMPKTEQPLHITRHHIPMLVYAPYLLSKPRVVEKVTSSVDVLTSIASLTGIEHINTSMGRNIFDERLDKERYAFAIWHTSPPRIGVIGDRYYFRMYADGREKSLFDLQSEDPFMNFKDRFPDKARRMEEITTGIYETTKHMLRNNGSPYREKMAGEAVSH